MFLKRFENKFQQVCGHLSPSQTLESSVALLLAREWRFVTCPVTGAVHYWYLGAVMCLCGHEVVGRQRRRVDGHCHIFILPGVSIVSCCTKNWVQPQYHHNSLEFVCNVRHQEPNLFDTKMTPPQFIGSQLYRPFTICWNRYDKGQVSCLSATCQQIHGLEG